MKPINVIQEFKDEITRLQHERDLYRARAIDEVADHHNATHQVATFDVDNEVLRHLRGVKVLVLAAALMLGAGAARAWEFPRNPDRFPSVGFNVTNGSISGHRDEVDTPPPTYLFRTNVGNTDMDTHTLGADLRLPLHESVTFVFGYDSIESNYHFVRAGDVFHETERLSGYRYTVGFRLYLNH